MAAVLQLRQAMRMQAAPGRTDPITRLPNRLQFQADHADGRRPVSTLVLITLAEERAFNELLRALGHARSEAFIRAGAQRLMEILGASTSVYHVSMLSFAFCLPGHAEPDPPAQINRIAEGFRLPILCDDVPIDTRIGIGLKAFGGRCASPAEDLRAALSAAEDCRSGPGDWAWYDRKSDEAHRRAFRLLSDLKDALDADGQLELHFQPKVALASGTCGSAEALVRWTHPDFGPVSPGEFVPLAETTALVTPLTRWVIDAATRQAAIWRRDGIELAVAVNVSPKNLEEPDFVEFLTFCCAARALPRSAIELEVTEGVSAARGRMVRDRLAALAALGFSIAIDDFGSGYSNMAYLTQLSAGTLKLDRSLVKGAGAGPAGCQLVAGIAGMARDLGFRIVAEGIETPEQAALLARLGCDIGQGYHFARPMPAEAFTDWWRERKTATSAAASTAPRVQGR
jgi:EAL domain-containing protein (putative c-di-GMP-specific phosphodiesterase class I)/GGDEF domain-containing protein